ncbi:MAG TPA: heme-binding protein, partial [Gemmatimonadales bacterium]|nr:heme-binding protein [Gemmatimonadales bacterium]
MLAAVLAGCGGGGGSGSSVPPPADPPRLAVVAVERIVAQAVAEAQARGARAHVAVVDRSGNVLAVYSMPGAPENVIVSSGVAPPGGLETRSPVVPAPLAAISKAITGAYLSSHGNAFSTRTAGQIVQEHFNPNEAQQ